MLICYSTTKLYTHVKFRITKKVLLVVCKQIEVSTHTIPLNTSFCTSIGNFCSVFFAIKSFKSMVFTHFVLSASILTGVDPETFIVKVSKFSGGIDGPREAESSAGSSFASLFSSVDVPVLLSPVGLSFAFPAVEEDEVAGFSSSGLSLFRTSLSSGGGETSGVPDIFLALGRVSQT